MAGKQESRVVVTGTGAVSCLGLGDTSLRLALTEPRSGIRIIEQQTDGPGKTTAGAQLLHDEFTAACKQANIRYGDVALDAAALASDQALQQASLIEREPDAPPIALIVGAGASNVEQYFKANETFFKKGPRWVRPTTVPRCMNNAISAQISIRHHLTGPNVVVSAACASSTMAIGHALRMIRHGYCQQVLCVGADTIYSPFSFAAWDNLGVMSRNPDPASACRPFDRNRDGCVIGEGAAAILLESHDSALKRGVKIRAEICGYGESSDASHMTTPSVDGQVAAMQTALDDANITPGDLGWVHAHGTGTIANDHAECLSLTKVLGNTAKAIPVVSLKPYYGHMLGAAGTMDLLATIICLEEAFVPAAMNLTEPDDCTQHLYMAPNTVSSCSQPYALKSSFGFGGSNAAIIAKRYLG